MATASDIIIRALTRLGIRASETDLQADEMQDGLTMLNDMLAEWETLYQLGFAPVAAVGDIVEIPRYANLAVIDNLAIRLAPEYSRPVSPALLASSQASIKNIINTSVDLSNVDYPSTLPYGSGNEDNNGTDLTFMPQKGKVNF